MDALLYLFGQGENLTLLQICMRAVLIFPITLILIRISGRRSFGQRMPFDNVITILLGALLSRPVMGVSELGPSLCAAVIIATLHRLLAWFALKNHSFGKLIKGEALILFENGKFDENNLSKCEISKEDVTENIRSKINRDSLDEIKKIVVERNGEISIVTKK